MEESTNELRSTADSAAGVRGSGAWWRLPLLLTVVLATILIVRATRVDERTPAPRKLPAAPAAATGKSVALVIDYGDGRERTFDAIAWHEGMTVDDLLNAASQMANPISYGVAGDGEMTLLTRIDESHNQWEHGSNWTYKVNDVAADRSMAIYDLQPGDRVLWTFGKPQ
jgi:hypothetical protein